MSRTRRTQAALASVPILFKNGRVQLHRASTVRENQACFQVRVDKNVQSYFILLGSCCVARSAQPTSSRDRKPPATPVSSARGLTTWFVCRPTFFTFPPKSSCIWPPPFFFSTEVVFCSLPPIWAVRSCAKQRCHFCHAFCSLLIW